MSSAPANIAPAPCLEALERAAFEPERWPQALELIGRFVGAQMFALLRLDSTGPDMLGPPQAEGHLQSYLEGEWWGRDLRGTRALMAPAGALIGDDELVDPLERAGADFYRDFAASQDVPFTLGWRFGADERSYVFTAMRSAAQGPPRAAERQRLGLIKESATAAAQISDALRRAHGQGRIEGLEAAGAAVAALDHAGRVVAATAQAQPYLEGHFTLAEGRLSAADKTAAAALARLSEILARAGAGPPESFVLPRPSGRGIHCTPIMLRGAGLDLFSRARALLVMRDLDAEPQSSRPLLQALYKLTAAELDVALRLGAGASVEDLSRERGVTPNTTRTILGHIYRKTGASRQNELAALVARLS